MSDKKDISQLIRSKTTAKLEIFFYKYGIVVGENPWKFILGSLLLASLCCLGLLKFHQEKHPMKLWIPPGCDFERDTEWLMTEFGVGFRIQSVLITAPDVLEPSILLQKSQTPKSEFYKFENTLELLRSNEGLSELTELARIRRKVVESTLSNITWEDVCFRVPVVEMNVRKRKSLSNNLNGDTELNVIKKRTVDNDLFHEDEDEQLLEQTDYSIFTFDPSIFLSTEKFCSIVRSFSTGCYEHSILEFWKYDEEELKTLTKEQIIFALNYTAISPVLGLKMEYTHLLGGIERNTSGVIIKAKSLLSLWMVHVNFSAVNMDEVGNDGGTADWATGPGMIWEESFLRTMENVTYEQIDGIDVYYEASRSFGDISSAAMFQDMQKIMLGVVMMFTFVYFVMSKCNWLELRIIPAGAGLACIGLAFVSACGICSALGIFYGPVHTSLPFLLMGIGVDDMFVIMACRNQLSHQQRRRSIGEQIGLTLKRAGVSITVTSFTDIVASTIGGTTILPALESFCLYAAAGVLMTFIFQGTFFTAFLVLDERRIQQSRNAVMPCIIHKHHKPNKCSQVEISKNIIHFLFSKLFLTRSGKLLVLIGTCGLTALCIKGNLNLRQEFDPKWFLPSDSHLVEFLNIREKYYSDSGQDVSVFFGRLNYTEELRNIHKLVVQLYKQKDIIKEIDVWYEGFRRYINYNFNRDIPYEVLTELEFSLYISKYLYSPGGAKYQKNFRFDGKLECGEPAPPITVSSLDFKFRLFNGPEEALPAMNRVKALVQNSNITSGDGFKTVWGKIFANWVTDEVIQRELYRNLLLAVFCVMLTTTVLVLNVGACFWIFICVFLTLVDVCGMMYYWGLTVDIVSCIALVLAVGLCVDYAAHVGQTFLHHHGSRNERVLQTMESIGTAVLNGGTSTLLAMSVLSLSNAYVFQAFFKIFFLLVVIGLFHGVVFLPVVLSVVGPKSHPSFTEFDTQASLSSEMKPEETEKLNNATSSSNSNTELNNASQNTADHTVAGIIV